jgi:hypothetical protein
MRFLSPQRQASSLGRAYDFRTNWTGSADGKTKLDLDDLLIARPSRCPTAAGLPLRTAGLLVFPVNREIGSGIAVLFSCPARDNLWRLGPPDQPRSGGLARHQRLSIHISCIARVAALEVLLVGLTPRESLEVPAELG